MAWLSNRTECMATHHDVIMIADRPIDRQLVVHGSVHGDRLNLKAQMTTKRKQKNSAKEPPLLTRSLIKT